MPPSPAGEGLVKPFARLIDAENIRAVSSDSRGRLSLQLKNSLGLNKFHFCKASERYNSLPLWESLGNKLPRGPQK